MTSITLLERYAVGLQPARIDRDLVLLDEAADAGDLGDALRLGQLVAQEPVLDGAQLGRACRFFASSAYW